MNSFDKQTMRQWLYEIDKVKAENKRFEELLTKGKDKRIEILIKENRELRKQNKEIMDNYIMSEKAADARIEQLEKDMEYYRKFYEEHDGPIDRGAYDNDKN